MCVALTRTYVASIVRSAEIMASSGSVSISTGVPFTSTERVLPDQHARVALPSDMLDMVNNTDVDEVTRL